MAETCKLALLLRLKDFTSDLYNNVPADKASFGEISF